jgi:predicted phosphodiesterase
VRINYFSDIHLEFGNLEAPANDADLIIAAGDIGICDQGVAWLKTFDKPVIYVAGNHEFYSHEYREALLLIREECQRSNIQFLENRSFIFQQVRFLGCTLWADLYAEGREKTDCLRESLNDFKKIRLDGKALNADEFTSLHQHSKAWLENELAQPFSGKTVVVTHHAPSEWSWNEAPSAAKKLAYCNDLKALMHQYDIAAWFHGHTHNLIDYRIAGTRILCNPRGYTGIKTVEGFDLNRTVDI